MVEVKLRDLSKDFSNLSTFFKKFVLIQKYIGGVSNGPLAVMHEKDLIVSCAGNKMKIRSRQTGSTEWTSCAKHVDNISCVAVNDDECLIASASNAVISILKAK